MPRNNELDALERTISKLGKLIQSVLPVIEEGAQVWDSSGTILLSNNAAEKHYGNLRSKEIKSYLTLANLCLDECGIPISNNDFPVAQVINTGKPCTGNIYQISAQQAIWLRINAYPIISEASELSGVLSTSHDLTSMVVKGLSLEMDAHYDALTGLPNRLLLPDRMKLALARSERTGDMLAVCMLDLDGFKPVNDSLGHEAGDILLREVAERLMKIMRSEDTALRLGGDEFVILMSGIRSVEDCELAVNRVLATIASPFRILENTIRITASIGITLYPNDSSVSDHLLRHADQAMYKAKEKGKNCYYLFDTTLNSKLSANLSTIKRIEKAITEEQFKLYYQPITDCSKGKVVGVEALIRWHHPVLGIRLPAEFLPLIEQDKIIFKIGTWVLNTAIQQIDKWRSEGLDLQVSINISAHLLLRHGLDKMFEHALQNHNIELFNNLTIEITENTALEDMETVNAIMRQYEEKGISFALDDFGTGYSSLTHLKHLASSTLKIDQGFIREMLFNPDDLAIVQGIIGLANAFQNEVVAEGVETIEQVLILLELGCQNIQGYSIAHPMPAEKISGWVRDFKPDPRWRVAHSSYPMRVDFELLLIEVSHRHWLEKIRQMKTDSSKTHDACSANYINCRLTKWYTQVGLPSYSPRQELQKIDALHKKVHDIAECFLNCNKEKQPEKVEEISKQLNVANEKLVYALREFRTSVVSEEERHNINSHHI